MSDLDDAIERVKNEIHIYKASNDDDGFTNDLETIIKALEKARQAIKAIKALQREQRKIAMDAAAEQRWQDIQGDEYGSY